MGVAEGVVPGSSEIFDVVGVAVGVTPGSNDKEGVVVGVASKFVEDVGVGVSPILVDGVGVGLASTTSGTSPIAASIVLEGVMLCVIDTLGVGVGVKNLVGVGVIPSKLVHDALLS